MTLASRDGDRIVINAEIYEKELVAQLPGASWSKTENVWKAPLSWSTCLVLRGLFGTRLKIDQSLLDWSWQEYNTKIAPAMKLREAMSLPDDHEVSQILQKIEGDLRLKDFQRAGVAYLTLMERALLCDEMGTGKTAQTIRTIQVLREMGKHPLPVLVVCPKSLKYTVWEKELKVWAPELRSIVIEGPIAKRRKQLAEEADVYIIGWDLLRVHSRISPFGSTRLTPEQKKDKELNALGHRTIVMDEAHRLCTIGSVKKDGERIPKSLQAQAAWTVSHQAEFRFALTGTPIDRDVSDLWGIEHAVLPEWFPAKSRYLDRWAQTVLSFWGGREITGLNPVTEEEFHKVVDPTFRRIPKKLVLPQLPPQLPVQYRHTPMTPRQAQLYRQMEEEQLALLDEDGGYVAAATQLSRLTRLLQFAAASAVLNEDGEVRLSNPSSKVDDLVDLLEEMGDEPLVVASVHRQLIELAAAKLGSLHISHALVTGRQSAYERMEAVEDFQNAKFRVILLTLGAGAEGITLTRSNKLLFMNESWEQRENAQTIGRIDRIGAEHHASLSIIKQVTPDTVETRKIEVLEGKIARTEEVLRDKKIIRRLLGE